MFARLACLAVLIAVACHIPDIAHAADFDVKAATDAHLAVVTGEARAKSDAYFEGGYWLILWDALIGIGVMLLLLFTRASAGMRNLAERIAPWRPVQTFVFGVLFILAWTILTFPMSLYEGFYREHEFGLSNMSLADWLEEFGIGLALQLVFGSLFLVVIYGVIRRAPRSWWIWATVVATAFIVLQAVAFPVYIAPLFNEYKPMAEGQLKSEILSLARANGIPTDNVYQVDASRQSKRISANVSGFLGTTRISLNDNLLNRATPAEVKAVMGHEMGHYALNHMTKMIVYFSLLAAVSFAFASWGFAVLHSGFGAFWGVRDVGDVAGLPALIAPLTLFMLIATPIQNSIIRENEAQADLFGLNAVREPDAFASAIVKLAEYRKLDPAPWEEIVFYDHPSGRSRVSMAMQWKAENLNSLPPAPAPGADAAAAASEPAAAEPVPPPQPAADSAAVP